MVVEDMEDDVLLRCEGLYKTFISGLIKTTETHAVKDVNFICNKGEVVSLLGKYPKEGSLAVGDSENDLEMLEQVELPICFNPNDRLLKLANDRGWIVVDENSIIDELNRIINLSD